MALSPGKVLFKYLLKQIKLIPNPERDYYRNFLYEQFYQNLTETNPQRIEFLISKAYCDSDWIISKFKTKKNNTTNVERNHDPL